MCCHFSSTLPLPHPPDSFFFGSCLLRPRGRPELGAGRTTSSSSSLEPAAYSCFIIGRLRSGILSFITGRLCSCRLICVIGSVTAFTSGPIGPDVNAVTDSIVVVYVVKKNFFENLKLFKKPQATFKSQNSMKYIYIIAQQLTLSQYSYNKSFPQQKLAIFQGKDKRKTSLPRSSS